jgi:CRP-like cAMP-binding protein
MRIEAGSAYETRIGNQPEPAKGGDVITQLAGPQPRNRILRLLPENVYSQLCPYLEAITFNKGDVIYGAGDRIENIFFIESGLVVLYKIMQDGRSVEVGVVGSEGVVGLAGIIGANTAIADSDVQLSGNSLRIKADLVRAAVENDENARLILHRYSQFFIEQLIQIAACNALHSLEQRCCRWLLTAHDSVRSDTLTVTHEFLATMLGVQRAGVSLAVGNLQRRGMIRCGRGVVTILNREALELSACECHKAIRSELEALLPLYCHPGMPANLIYR